MTEAVELVLLPCAVLSFSLGWFLSGTAGASKSFKQLLLSGRFPALARLLPLDESAKSGIADQSRDYLLLGKAPIGYLEIDEENQLIWINPAACQILGLPCDKQDMGLPRLLLELVRSYELDQLIETTRRAQASHQKDWILNLVTPDPINPNAGVSHPLRGQAVPLEENHVGVFLENRQEATTLMQQRDRWTSDVAHELKTPLTSIRLVAETLRDRVAPDLTKWLDRLLNEILRLSNLVEDLLNLSRLKRSGGTGLALKPVDLSQLLLAAWQSLEPLANTKQIDIAYEGASSLIVPLDETLMYRVFINLIDNAIKYSPCEGVITFRAELSNNAQGLLPGVPETQVLVIEVIDEGAGFRMRDLPHIFDRFYRADPSRSRTYSPLPAMAAPANQPVESSRSNGSGLGLAIVQQIIEAHNGTAQASNHPETGGGWLTLAIPVSPLSLEDLRAS